MNEVKLCKGTIVALGPSVHVFSTGNIRIDTDTGSTMVFNANKAALALLRIGQTVSVFARFEDTESEVK